MKIVVVSILVLFLLGSCGERIREFMDDRRPGVPETIFDSPVISLTKTPNWAYTPELGDWGTPSGGN